MKICSQCGKEIEDSFNVCPYCGNYVVSNKPIEVKRQQVGRKKMTKTESMLTPVTIWDKIFGPHPQHKLINITSCIIGLTGGILFLVYFIKEMIFRTQNDLSGLTSAGVDLLRIATGDELNIIMIVVGIAIMVFAELYNISMMMIVNNQLATVIMLERIENKEK